MYEIPRPLPAFTTSEEETLAANLNALSAVDPDLATRLTWPCDTSRTLLDTQGRLCLRVSRDLRPLQTAAVPLPDSKPPEAAFLLGCGLGEPVSAWLTDAATTRIHVYERDPWMLRLCLARNDWSEAIGLGRLELLLGIDLAQARAALVTLPRYHHPLLGQLYAWEDRFLDTPVTCPILFVMPGALFVDDLAAELSDTGAAVFPFDGNAWSLDELDHSLAAGRPRAVFSVNFVPGLDELLSRRNIPYRCWEIDPCLDPKDPLSSPRQECSKISTWCRRGVAEFQAMGFSNVEWLPLATRPATRHAPGMSEEERAHYRAPLAFVGNSMQNEARKAEQRFLELWHLHARVSGGQPQTGPDLIQNALDLQSSVSDRYILPDYLAEHVPEFLRFMHTQPGCEDPVTLLGEVAASRKRLEWIQSLAPLGIQVWGDEGWRSIDGRGLRYRGPAGHRLELNKIYASAQIQIDLGRIYQEDIVTMRVFDALACGAFVLAPWCEDLEELFNLPTELESYRSLEELGEKATWYLSRPDRCRSIARKGQEAVLTRHRMDQRVACLLEGLDPAIRPMGLIQRPRTISVTSATPNPVPRS